MKKTAFLLITSLVILSLASPVSAQDSGGEKKFRFTIKTNPLSALGGPLFIAGIVPLTAEYKVYFEAKTAEKQSVQLGIGYLGSSPLVTSIGDLSSDTSIVSTGVHGQVWYKFFLTSEEAPDGFYLAPHFSYATAKIKNNKENDKYFTASKLNISCVFGYQLITKGGFALDIYTGLGIKNKKFDSTGFDLGETFSDWKLNNRTTIGVPVGFSFGYAF